MREFVKINFSDFYNIMLYVFHFLYVNCRYYWYNREEINTHIYLLKLKYYLTPDVNMVLKVVQRKMVSVGNHFKIL